MAGRATWRALLVTVTCASLSTVACAPLDERFEREGSKPPPRVESARFFMTTLPLSDEEDVPKDLVARVEGEISHHGGRARLGLDIPSVPGGVPGTDIEFILVGDDRIYFRAPADPKLTPKGKEWVLIPPEEQARFTAGFEDYIEFLTNGNFLEAKSPPDEDRTGTESVRGITTEVYSSTINVEEMAAEVGLDQEQVEDINSVTGSELEITMWLDEVGFVRRTDMPITIPSEVTGQDETVLFRLELFDHGAEGVGVEEPPASEVLEL